MSAGDRAGCSQPEGEGNDGVSTSPKEQEKDVIMTEIPDGAKGITAFFVFSNLHRELVKQQLQSSAAEGEKVKVGDIAKRIGELWRDLGDDIKQSYVKQANHNREHQKDAPAAVAAEDDADATPPGLPLSTVKKLIMLDPDHTRVAAEAVRAVACAAELFLEALAQRSGTEAAAAARQTVAFRDIDSSLRSWKATGWAESPFLDIPAPARSAGQSTHNKALEQAARGTKRLDAIFQRAAKS